ncbi:MAG: hypothetical protein IT561_07845 [Alphaproteobacteria bacterium]|nr:hypothetical protein [Alphaproteobacteria bacterium]
MTDTSWPLAAAALFWIALHLGIAGSPLRALATRRLGDNGFRAAFSLLSLLGILALAITYRRADGAPLWDLGPAGRWLPLLLMLPALWLFVGSVTGINPTAVGGERQLDREDLVRGVFRVTRHPMLWAFALWAGSHLAARGAMPDALLFGSLLVTALAGMASIDRKRAAAAPAAWGRFAAATSIVPFVAILGRRNRLVWSEIGGWRLLLAVLAWGLLAALHPIVIGVPALPG